MSSISSSREWLTLVRDFSSVSVSLMLMFLNAGLSQILHSDPRLLAEAYGSSSSSSATFGISPSSNSHQAAKKEKSTVLESLELQYRHVRSTIKSILANPDSKKIYYFLCLNLAFMFVQMM